MPSTPLETKSLTEFAHHERVFSLVKSGKTQGPGHTSPDNVGRKEDQLFNTQLYE